MSVWPLSSVICTPLWGVEGSPWSSGSWAGVVLGVRLFRPCLSGAQGLLPGDPHPARHTERIRQGLVLAVAAQRASAVLWGQEEVVTCTVPGAGGPAHRTVRASRVCPHLGHSFRTRQRGPRVPVPMEESRWPAARAGPEPVSSGSPGLACAGGRPPPWGPSLPAHCSYWEPEMILPVGPCPAAPRALGSRGPAPEEHCAGVGGCGWSWDWS